MAEEILYPMDLIRWTLRSWLNDEPVDDFRADEHRDWWIDKSTWFEDKERHSIKTIDQLIERIDVSRTFEQLPPQYQQVLRAWYNFDGDRLGMAMELGRSVADTEVTIRSAWDYLYYVLNTEPE